MALLSVVTFFWGNKYSLEYVHKLAAGVKRNLAEPHRFIVISDRSVEIDGVENFAIPAADLELTHRKGCFARLRLFDPTWQKLANCHDRIVCMDLDAVVTGALDPLFASKQPFLILQGANAVNPCPYNGSIWMTRAGYRPDVWNDFSLKAAAQIPFYDFPDDQGWFWHKLSGAAGWKVAESGIYGFQKPGWPGNGELPANARYVAFFGSRDPSRFTDIAWVRDNWRE